MGDPRNTIFAFSDNAQAVSKRCKDRPHRQAPQPHPLRGQGDMEVKQLHAFNKENPLKIQNLESGMRRLKNDFEEEVNNN